MAKLTKVNTSGLEEELLRNYVKTSPLHLVRFKAQAILIATKGMTPTDIGGRRTVIKVDRKKQSQSYIGFLNQKSFKCHLYEMPWQNSEEGLKAMEQFLHEYPDKKICIVWDNAAFHRSKAIREQLQKGGIMERVHLIAMPPYAPDNNPIETCLEYRQASSRQHPTRDIRSNETGIWRLRRLTPVSFLVFVILIWEGYSLDDPLSVAWVQVLSSETRRHPRVFSVTIGS